MLKVVKIGGNIVDNPEKLDSFLKDFAAMKGHKILIHGGGKVATTISKALGIETQMINGRRVTDEETLKVVTMVYAGVINKNIVNKLNAAGCPAVGICGADARFITSQRRSPEPIDYGFVGDPVKINTRFSETLMNEGYTIVVAPITTNGKETLLNTNADTVAQAVAVAHAQTEETSLIYCFEKKGVLRDMEDEDSVITEITQESFKTLKTEGVVDGGMLPKLENAFKALDEGVSQVVICEAGSILEDGFGGTVITK